MRYYAPYGACDPPNPCHQSTLGNDAELNYLRISCILSHPELACNAHCAAQAERGCTSRNISGDVELHEFSYKLLSEVLVGFLEVLYVAPGARNIALMISLVINQSNAIPCKHPDAYMQL